MVFAARRPSVQGPYRPTPYPQCTAPHRAPHWTHPSDEDEASKQQAGLGQLTWPGHGRSWSQLVAAGLSAERPGDTPRSTDFQCPKSGVQPGSSAVRRQEQ